ncbi:hypothetical protein IW967_13475 [Alicyclobacillus mali]|uniref:Uncharacterized protein n=1 Tax=Alicyclobacillus mali (ex Roth et al. 2021) TaxID=1123961 RepID=A0ABS0F6D4_9BACL|nr:hypothetical protein [Alicyclobacillus mali (ex Roth et al. 2021)]MBF8378861.1 hypothetical protein [Alicyclobacillus mali (ex Roth et al. 2021)]MCL6489230.1 hypothetical protein [Alicyclobacillus mali (ex Roth et al. 2021)]
MTMRKGGFRGAIAILSACAWLAWGAPADARVSASASTDFGPHHRLHHPARRVILVNETDAGGCVLERRRVDDDAVVAFAGSRPAWRLDIPLSCYFLAPVYLRDPGGRIPGDRSV